MGWSLTRIHGEADTKILSETVLQGGTQEVEVVAPGTSIIEDAMHRLLDEHVMTAMDVGSIEGVSTTTREDSDKKW